MVQPTWIAAAAGLFLATIATPAVAAGAIVSGSCENLPEPRVVVDVAGLKSRVGTLRVQLYGPSPDEFLRRGAWLSRTDLPVVSAGSIRVCLPLPEPGRYAVAVRHDANANGKSDWNDGGGFSGNPKLSLFRLKPQYREVSFDADAGTTMLGVILNYRRGLSIRPLKVTRTD